MAITAQMVKELRDKTGAGMMDCKKALSEAGGDFEKAIEILRKKGASVAAKRAEKAANEGKILTKILSDNEAIIVEVNCETDFVAKSDDFVGFADFVLSVIEAEKPSNVEELKGLSLDGKSVSGELTNIIGKIGEKIEISRFSIIKSDNGLIVDYIHHGSKLGVLVKAEDVSADQKEDLQVFMKDIAMQVAAMRPLYVSRDDVPEDVKSKEMEIYKEIALKEGKPEQVVDKIAMGKLNKYYQENCLVEQISIKDSSKKVSDLLKEINTKYSAKASIVSFERFHLSDENK
jgi:elongation factor Ts